MKFIYKHPRIYDFLDSLITFGLNNKARKYVFKKISGKILEVGVGTGKSSFFTKHKLFGTDISEPMLNISKKRLNGRVKLAGAHKLPFKKNSFDWALFIFSLPSKNPASAIKEALRVGKKVLILEYKPLPKFIEKFGNKLFGAPNWNIAKLLKPFKYSRERYLKLFDIYIIKR